MPFGLLKGESKLTEFHTFIKSFSFSHHLGPFYYMLHAIELKTHVHLLICAFFFGGGGSDIFYDKPIPVPKIDLTCG